MQTNKLNTSTVINPSFITQFLDEKLYHQLLENSLLHTVTIPELLRTIIQFHLRRTTINEDLENSNFNSKLPNKDTHNLSFSSSNKDTSVQLKYAIKSDYFTSLYFRAIKLKLTPTEYLKQLYTHYVNTTNDCVEVFEEYI